MVLERRCFGHSCWYSFITLIKYYPSITCSVSLKEAIFLKKKKVNKVKATLILSNFPSKSPLTFLWRNQMMKNANLWNIKLILKNEEMTRFGIERAAAVRCNLLIRLMYCHTAAHCVQTLRVLSYQLIPYFSCISSASHKVPMFKLCQNDIM